MTDQRGFGLVEVLMAGLILTLISGAVLVLAQTGGQLWGRADARLASFTDVQRAFDRLTEDLRVASGASLNCTPPAPNDLTLTRTQQDSAGAFSVSYDHSGTQLLRNGQVIASEVEGFQVAGCPVRLVTLTLTVGTTRWASPRTLTSRVWVQNP